MAPESSAQPDRVLRRLWAVLPTLTVLEYKSPGAPPRAGVFDQLFAYGHIVARRRRGELPRGPTDLALVLATATITPTVRKEAERYGLRILAEDGGLYRVEGTLITTWLLALNEASIDVGESLLGFFGSGDGAQWLAGHYMGNTEKLKNLPGSDELEKRFKSSPVFERLMRERLADDPSYLLTVLSEMPIETLSQMPVEKLSREAKAELLRRLQANDDER